MPNMVRYVGLLAIVFSTVLIHKAADAQCELGWSGGFGKPGLNNAVYGLTVFSTNGVDRLDATGSFDKVGSVSATSIGEWDGGSWSAFQGLWTNASGTSFTSAWFDDGSGSGPQLYVGTMAIGSGTVGSTGIGKWNGTAWATVGGGTNGAVQSLIVFDDDGNGPHAPALYAGGDFTTAGGVSVNYIAKWNGSIWSPLGAGADSFVKALTVYDDGAGGGPALFAGGWFSHMNGQTAKSIAKWNGSSWTQVGTGITGLVSTLTTFDDDGPGPHAPALYAGGVFTNAGGATAKNIAKWSGSAWSALGTGASGQGGVNAILGFDDGSGPAIYAGGDFQIAGGNPVHRIARWNGSTWSDVGGGMGGVVYALAAFDDGTGPALIAGGQFGYAGDLSVMHIAKWNGLTWLPFGSGCNSNLDIHVVKGFDDGAGPALYAGGEFTSFQAVNGIGGQPANRIAKWDGTRWYALGSGTNSIVHALTSFDDDGAGPHPPALFAGGFFTQAGGDVANLIAKWNGTVWSALGGGLSGSSVISLTVYNDGNGDALYAGGEFGSASGVVVNSIAQWNGSSWSGLGSGLTWGKGIGYARTMAVFDDDGPGPNPSSLYVGGTFDTAGGIAVNNFAKWDGSSWIAVNTGLGFQPSTLSTLDLGSGPALYATGFNQAAGKAQIAFFNGQSWTMLGQGMTMPTSPAYVNALETFDDGNGARLYAAGDFMMADGHTANHIAKWDGTTWTALGKGLGIGSFAQASMTAFNDGHGSSLFVGGSFVSAGGIDSNKIAKWTHMGLPPQIITQPTDQSVNVGQSAQFSVVASGESLLYQWRKNRVLLEDGRTVSGATTPALTISQVTSNDAGNYDVIVTSLCGSTTSSAATLTVVQPCVADVSPSGGDGVVNVDDLLAVINGWGDCPVPPTVCPADIAPPGGNNIVNVDDLLAVINAWGPCP